MYFVIVIALMLVLPLTSIGLGIKAPDATPIVREVGFANTAIGSIGLASLFFHDWQFPIALVRTIFYGLAGINHVTDRHRNKLQSFAMVSDLFAAGILLIACYVSYAGRTGI